MVKDVQLIRVIKREYSPKKLKELKPDQMFWFSGVNQGCSFTKTCCHNYDPAKARAHARTIPVFKDGATIIAAESVLVWQGKCSYTHQIYEAYLDSNIRDAADGHVALRLKNVSLGQNVPIGEKRSKEEELIQRQCKSFLHKIFVDDEGYI